MKRTKFQFGTLQRKKRKKGPDVWVLRYYRWENAQRVYASRIVGTAEEHPTRALAERAAESIRMEANISEPGRVPVTVRGLADRYVADKLPERYSTRCSYLSCLNGYIKPKWGDCTLGRVAKAPFEVEKWFEGLELAPKTKGNIKSLMYRLFECAMKWGLYPQGRNPMEFVEIKNRTKRRRKPRVLSYDEFWVLLTFIQQPYRTMVLVAQCLGLRISEVMALRWSDLDFEDFTVRVQRSIVHGRVDDVKTEYSDDDLPLDRDVAAMMLDWKSQCPATPEGWIFPNPSTQKPYWQESACTDYIKPAGEKAGLGSNIGWHTFRHTYRAWLDASEAPISLQRELMRHASIQTTMDTYGRATMTPAKREFNSKVARMALKPLIKRAKEKGPTRANALLLPKAPSGESCNRGK